MVGWVDMPFAEACSLCGVTEFMTMLFDNPSLAHRILDFLTDCVIDFSLAQLEVGAPMIGAGDAAASRETWIPWPTCCGPRRRSVPNAVPVFSRKQTVCGSC